MDIFTKFKQALKIREVLVDNNVFQLHYRVTALMLLCCAGLVASKQHFGDPIDCITRDDVPNKIMDTYCWIHATFTLPGACNKTVGVEVAHPCVDKSSVGPGASYASNTEERVYHKYYQWVYFVLFFQAAFFYAPHFFWKSCEARLLRTLTADLRDPLYQKSEKKKQARLVARYLDTRRAQHQRYYYCFVMFELINLLNVIVQMYVVDEFLGGTFTTYGLDVINYAQLEQDDRIDPMVRVFPRMTKCSFHRFGSSGDVQKYDALCILPLNIINEKIYIIMWFWFVFLAFVTTLWLCYRALTFLKPNLRLQMLRRRANLAPDPHLEIVIRHGQTGDWFLLCMMCKNIDSRWFKYVVVKLARNIMRRKAKAKRKASLEARSNGNNNNNSLNGNYRKSLLARDGRRGFGDTKALMWAATFENEAEERRLEEEFEFEDAELSDTSDEESEDDDDTSSSNSQATPAPFIGVTVEPKEKQAHA